MLEIIVGLLSGDTRNQPSMRSTVDRIAEWVGLTLASSAEAQRVWDHRWLLPGDARNQPNLHALDR